MKKHYAGQSILATAILIIPSLLYAADESSLMVALFGGLFQTLKSIFDSVYVTAGVPALSGLAGALMPTVSYIKMEGALGKLIQVVIAALAAFGIVKVLQGLLGAAIGG